MAAKYFCDVCENEMKSGECGRFTAKIGKVTVEVMHAVDDVWNGGHVCHACIKMAVANGEAGAKGLTQAAA